MKSIGSRKCIVPRPMVELIKELKVKLNLYDSERIAVYEENFNVIQSNKKKIEKLRVEVEELNTAFKQEIKHKDRQVIWSALQNRCVEKRAFKAKTTEVAIEDYDFLVSDTMKRYNHSKYVTCTKEKKLKELKWELSMIEKELASDISHKDLQMKQSQKIRDLENRVNKLDLKGTECECIQKTYAAIYKRLYEEHARCNSKLDEMECDILRCRSENVKLKKVYNKSKTLQSSIQQELKEHEKVELAHRKRRVIESAQMRNIRGTTMGEESVPMTITTYTTSTDSVEEESRAISEMCAIEESSVDTPSIDVVEDQINKLREVTGIPQLVDIVAKFERQMVMKKKLIGVVNQIEKDIQEIRTQFVIRQRKLHHIKFDRNTIYNKKQQVASGRNTKLYKNQLEDVEMADNLEHIHKFMALAKGSLQHMVGKLMHIKLPIERVVTISRTPCIEDCLKDLMAVIKQKIYLFMDELQGMDVDGYRKKLATEQKIVVLEPKDYKEKLMETMPFHNNRVTKSLTAQQNDEREDFDSDNDDPNFMNRLFVKNDSRKFIEMCLKKRLQKKK